MQLPEYQQPTRSGQPTPDRTIDPIKEQARQVAAAVDAVYVEKPTSYRDDTPLPVVGTAPPVAQPGRTPMSQGATDASVVMLCGGGAAFLVSGGVSLVMWASESADPVVCGIVFGAPVALALALGRLFGKVKATVEAAPAPVHNHFNGTVHQDQRRTTTKTVGVIANTRTQTR
ncbi:hypothetical protein ACFCX0_03575 [Streptomyces sp. NPDC056352]|uniref:hypothetical protein n=1 Tax=Streptomyces sp. NPDC056352 TaxID=3345791 RepID=UPI0035DC0C7E